MEILLVPQPEKFRRSTIGGAAIAKPKKQYFKNTAVQDEAARPPMLVEAVQDEAANAGRGHPGEAANAGRGCPGWGRPGWGREAANAGQGTTRLLTV